MTSERLTGLSHMAYADVNGLHLYYETAGEGTPVVLLHGGMMSIELSFAGLLPELATRHRVIGVELQGHGRTADIERPITPAHSAGDVVALLDHLDVDRAHVVGHSMGAAVALELADLLGWTDEQLAGISAPVLLVIGDRDFTTVEHGALMLALIPGAQLAVLPGTTHLQATRRPELLLPMLAAFLD